MLVALAVLGMMMMVSAGDLMALYMGLELQSLSLYVIAAMRRDSVRSTEAGLKYFILGALASGLLLYGASLVYGFAGTTLFSGIITTVAEGEMSLGLLFGLVFLLAGLAFKVSAVPFHMWTPDVYEGAPTPVTAFFATAPKVAAMALLARVLHDAFGTAPGDWGQIIAFLAVASMFLGAIAAIGQRDIKRLMAYSSITHMGFALVGLAAGTAQGVQAMLVYMAIYVTMNIGVFAFILSMERDGRPVTDITSLNMYAQARADQGAGHAGAAVQPCRRAAAGGLLRQVLRALGGGRGGDDLAGHRRRDRQRDRRVLLPAHRLLHVFRRGGRGARRCDAAGAMGLLLASAADHGRGRRQPLRDRRLRGGGGADPCPLRPTGPKASGAWSWRSATAPMPRRCAAAGSELTSPFWILARRQTAGRGRRGRPGRPEGNFAATLAHAPRRSAGQAALRSFTAALALFDAFVAGHRARRPAGAEMAQ
jgi:hypothetical protein